MVIAVDCSCILARGLGSSASDLPSALSFRNASSSRNAADGYQLQGRGRDTIAIELLPNGKTTGGQMNIMANRLRRLNVSKGSERTMQFYYLLVTQG